MKDILDREFSCHPWGPEKLWALSSADFTPERQNLGVRTFPRLFLQCRRTSRLDIPVLSGSLGWVQSCFVVKFGEISVGCSWPTLMELEACGGVSTEEWKWCRGDKVWPRSVGKSMPRKNTTTLLERFHCSWVSGGDGKASRRAFTMHKSSTLRSIISCWFKVRNERWLAWKRGNAAFLCSKSCGCLYLSSTGVA